MAVPRSVALIPESVLWMENRTTIDQISTFERGV